MAGRNVDLGSGQIQPAARPVSSFIQPAQIQAAAPAKPAQLQLSNTGAGLVSTAGRPNVPSSNPGQQFAEAMSAFSTNLTKTLQMGVELYATDEYQKGQNEAMKASMLAERQMDQSSIEYADANRRLAQKDPFAAMAMDQTNPFRAAGRQNALSQIAAGEINTAMTVAYRKSSGELVLKDPTDPAINQVKADAVNAVAQRYGLDESSPGFARHFLPALNRAWERVTAQHVQDRNDYLKDTVWRTAGASIANGMRQARNDGRDLGQAATMAGGLLDQEAVRLGLPGEATEMKVKAIQAAQQLLIADGEYAAANALGNTPVGPADEQGFRPTASQLYGLEMMEADDKYGEIRRRQKERALTPIREALSNEIAEIGLRMEDGQEKLDAIKATLAKPEYADLPYADKLEAIGKANKLGEDVMSQGYSSEAAGEFLANLDKKYGFGRQRNLEGAEADLQDVLTRTPQEDRARVRAQFNEWRNRQQKQPWELINPAVNNAIKANLEQRYPELGTAALRGINNIEGILQWGDAKSKESSAAQLSVYRSAVLSALDEKRTAFKRELTDLEAQTAIDKAIYDTNKRFQTDEALKNRLFPAIPDPSAKKPTPAPAGTRPSPVQGAKSPSTLDSLSDRETRLQNWRSQPVLNAEATVQAVRDALGGQPFDPAFRRAARDAGTTPEQLLIQQVDFYKNGIQLTPQQRNQILKKGNQTQALNDNRQARSSFGGSLASAASWMFDAVMGVRPAMASGNRELDLIRMYGPGGGGSFEKPVSVVYERPGGQPGVDLYFPSKRFPAVLGGVVKDVSRESGYGNYVVVESTDPLTGRKVDVLYGHLADGVKLRPGQQVSAGQVIGQQGGTGNVRSADGTIASIDFFAPRAAGSKDMTPYSGYDALRRHVVSSLQKGGGTGGSTAGDVSKLRRAIISKESGGNYSAVNPDSGALGIGQVMPSNVGPWTQKYLGRRLTPQQFLADRKAQDAVIDGRFRDILADQRAAGYSGEQAIRRAAAVWYSGSASKWNDTSPQYSNGRRYPSIAEYTKSIWNNYRSN